MKNSLLSNDYANQFISWRIIIFITAKVYSIYKLSVITCNNQYKFFPMTYEWSCQLLLINLLIAIIECVNLPQTCNGRISDKNVEL